MKWDLIYVIDGKDKSMSLAVFGGEGEGMYGPFPAAEAGPQIASKMVGLGICQSVKDAENAYVFRHFANMTSGENTAGQAYPFYVQ